MKQILLLISIAFVVTSCGEKVIEKKTDEPEANVPLNLPKISSYIGKTYDAIKGDFKGYKVVITESGGDKKAKIYVADEKSPISLYSCEISEKNKIITDILISSMYSGHDKNKNALQYFQEKINQISGYENTGRISIDSNDRPVAFFASKTDEDLYSYMRENPDYGGQIIGNTSSGVRVHNTCFGKSKNMYAIQIAKL